MTGSATPASRQEQALRDVHWQAMCNELRAAQQARLDFLAGLGGRAWRGGHASALSDTERATMAALEQAIHDIDDRMRAFTDEDAWPGGAAAAV